MAVLSAHDLPTGCLESLREAFEVARDCADVDVNLTNREAAAFYASVRRLRALPAFQKITTATQRTTVEDLLQVAESEEGVVRSAGPVPPR